MCGDFLTKRRAQRLGVYRWFLKKSDKKCCIKQSTTKRIKNRKLANLHRKNDFLKATMSQRHRDYYGFVKTGFETRPQKGTPGKLFGGHFGDTWSIWCHFWPHRISKGVPTSTIFEKNLKKMRKRRSKKRLKKNMICWSIFDVKMRGLKW